MSRPRIIEPDRLLPEIIDPALLVLGKPYDSRSAAAMLAYIAAHESDHLTATVQRGGGPARSLWQIEPPTYKASMKQARGRDLGAVVRCHILNLVDYTGVALLTEEDEGDPPFESLGEVIEQLWAAAVARLVLWEATSAKLPEEPPPPFEGKIEVADRHDFHADAAAYWHRWWCRGCKGTPEQFTQAARWLDSNGGDPLTYQPIGGRW